MAHMSNTIDNTSTADHQSVIDGYFECELTRLTSGELNLSNALSYLA